MAHNPRLSIEASYETALHAPRAHHGRLRHGPFGGGREISKAGTRDLPLGRESITGFTVVRAGSLDEAEKMAQSNPYIESVRVYEVMSR